MIYDPYVSTCTRLSPEYEGPGWSISPSVYIWVTRVYTRLCDTVYSYTETVLESPSCYKKPWTYLGVQENPSNESSLLTRINDSSNLYKTLSGTNVIVIEDFIYAPPVFTRFGGPSDKRKY